MPDYDGPITDVTSNDSSFLLNKYHLHIWSLDIICNGGINPYHQTISQAIITVPAGATLTTEWHHTLSGAGPSDPADPIDPSHKGPGISYLAAIPDATQSTVTGLKWFKIYEDGLSADGT
ncbi:hypothetical protein C0995_002022 [Termitomyces sp. Mi166|nr:hypothetical protein C0995_002022 [Termitomyces sp. Mi166\